MRHVLEDPRALAPFLRCAQHGLRDLRPPAHHAEAVAHPEERGIGGLADLVEEREQARLPGRVLADALRALARAVVAMGIDVARTPRADVDREASARGVRNHVALPDLEGQGADAQPGRLEDGGQVAGGVLHGVHDRVVPEVRPAVVHVQDGDVDRGLVGGRQVGRGFHAHVVVAVGGAQGRALLEAVLLAIGPLELAGVAARAEEEPRGRDHPRRV